MAMPYNANHSFAFKDRPEQSLVNARSTSFVCPK
jgi:hypothetical protein